jgi:hypothetical protein
MSKRNFTLLFYFVLLGITIAFPSCDDIIEYSPYKAGVKVPDKNLNVKAVSSIETKSSEEFQPFVIGLFGDTPTTPFADCRNTIRKNTIFRTGCILLHFTARNGKESLPPKAQ